MPDNNSILIVGAPARYPDIRYASGFFSPDPVIFLKTRRRPAAREYLVVSPVDLGSARRQAGKITVFSSADFPVARNSRSPLGDRLLGLLKKLRLRAVTVPFYFPAALFNRLKRAGLRVTVAEENIFPEREIKTRREVEYIRQAQRAAVKAMAAATAMIAAARIARDRTLKIGRKPLLSREVRARINAVVRDFNCVCYGTIVACGAQAANPHETGWGALKADKAIVIDIFPQQIEHGYFGDLTRTIVRGAPSPELQAMYRAVRDAQRAALAEIKDGVPARQVHQAATNLFQDRKFLTGRRRGRDFGFIHGTGHGLGLEIHEPPRVGLNASPLKQGMVITVEPGLYYPGRAGIRIEDTVLVTKTGCQILAPCHYPFVV